MILSNVRPRLPPLEAISDKLARCLYQGLVTNNGEHVQRFERELTEYLRAQTLCFNNGQTALMAMLMTAGVGPGCEVILPSFTFCATAHAVSMLGAQPVFADILPDKLTLDPLSVKTKLSAKTTAILGVDAYGICCEYDLLDQVRQGSSIYLLFDSAPAFGAMWGAFPTGNEGDAQIFSFHATKPFCVGEGGCLSTNNPGLYEGAKRIRDFGQTEDRECVEPGLNGKMQEVNALIGLENLKDWPEYRHRRTLKAATLRSCINEVGGIRAIHEPMEPAQWPIWCYFPILIEPEFGKSRDEVLAFLISKEVMARKYYSPGCHRLKPYLNGQSLPVTEMISDSVIALPLYADMRDEEMNYIADVLREAKK